MEEKFRLSFILFSDVGNVRQRRSRIASISAPDPSDQTNFCTRRNKPTLLSIVAERALKRLPASGSGSGLRSITPNGQETGEKSHFDVILHEGMSSLVEL
jgi:hypothetical protein